MKTLTLKIDEDTVDELDEETDERGYSSRSEYLREIIDARHEADEVRAEYEELLDELRQELDQAEARADDLRNQLEARQANVEETAEELVEKQERQDEVLSETLEWARAGLLTRTKWRLFGRTSTNGDIPDGDDVEDADTSKTEDARA
jgi:metal-responsive CopG/Arc/MetJ family transcriptional regulator